jgi:hypothetical protein
MVSQPARNRKAAQSHASISVVVFRQNRVRFDRIKPTGRVRARRGPMTSSGATRLLVVSEWDSAFGSICYMLITYWLFES